MNSAGPQRLTNRLSNRLSNRVLYAALLLLTLAGGAVGAARFAAELDHTQRLLTEGLRARSVSLDESFHVAQVATAALATEIGQRTGDTAPRDVRDLLRMAYNSRGTSDIAAFLYVRERQSACASASPAECAEWLAAAQDGPAPTPGERHWTPPWRAADGDWAVANVATVGSDGAFVAAVVSLSSLRKYTIPVHSVDSVVTLLDGQAGVLVDGDGNQTVGNRWRLAGDRGAPPPGADSLDEWAGKVTGIGAAYVAVDRVAGPAWFMIAEVPADALIGEAAAATSTLACTIFAVLVLMWAGMLVIESKVLRPARAAAEKLAETLNNLEVTFAAVSDGIALFDADRKLVACNSNFRNLLGLGEDVVWIGGDVPASLADQKPGDGNRTFQFSHPDGRWVEARWRDWTFGSRSGTVSVLTDVTEAHGATERLRAAKSQAEEALASLQNAQVQLVEAEKLAALGGLVAGVAHEINTPIGVAMSASTSLTEMTRQFIKELEQGTVRRSSFDRYLATMTEAVDLVERNLTRASDLITHFKQVAIDRTTCQRRQFDLCDVVTEIVATLNPTLKRTNFRVQVEIPKGITMDGYPGPLGQVITNLVTNAVLHAFEDRPSGTIGIGGCLGPGGVTLFCRDDGVGMPAAVVKRMFEPFFTTKRGRGGSGLGMHIVYSLVSGLMGGEIAVDSLPGEGTEIRMTLPLQAPQSAGTTTEFLERAEQYG